MGRCARANSSMVDACASAAREPSALGRRCPPMWRELTQRAVWLAAAFGIAHFLGLREWTCALLEGASSSPLERIGCVVYLFLYGSFFLVAPTLVIAALLLTIWDAFGRTVQARCARQK